MFPRAAESLRKVDAGVSAKVVRDKTRDAEIDGVMSSKKFNSHDGARQRSVGCAGKNSDETKGGKKGHRFLKKISNGVPERRSNEEERRNFAALVSATDGHCREHSFP